MVGVKEGRASKYLTQRRLARRLGYFAVFCDVLERVSVEFRLLRRCRARACPIVHSVAIHAVPPADTVCKGLKSRSVSLCASQAAVTQDAERP